MIEGSNDCSSLSGAGSRDPTVAGQTEQEQVCVVCVWLQFDDKPSKAGMTSSQLCLGRAAAKHRRAADAETFKTLVGERSRYRKSTGKEFWLTNT